jgi:hypothetical protein
VDAVAAAGRTSGRLAAYADLVAAVLDLRTPDATGRFDQALTDAMAAGSLSPALARELRMLQRDAERALVDHAAAVLPAALVALDHREPAPGLAADRLDHPADPVADQLDPDTAPEPLTDPSPEPPADLTARRLLVAGLRPINDPHQGTLP